METAKAVLNNYRQSPRKVRLVANFMRGKNAETLLASLDHVDKRASEALKKLLQSALSNAKSRDIATDKLVVCEVTVNSGATLFRRMPAPRGRAMTIRKRTSKIVLVLGERKGKGTKAASEAQPLEEKKAEKKPAKAKAAPKKATK